MSCQNITYPKCFCGLESHPDLAGSLQRSPDLLAKFGGRFAAGSGTGEQGKEKSKEKGMEKKEKRIGKEGEICPRKDVKDPPMPPGLPSVKCGWLPPGVVGCLRGWSRSGIL